MFKTFQNPGWWQKFGGLYYIYIYIVYINWDYNDYKNQGNPNRNQALGPPCFGQKAIGGDLAAEPQRLGFCHQPLHTTVPCCEWDGGWASEKMGETWETPNTGQKDHHFDGHLQKMRSQTIVFFCFLFFKAKPYSAQESLFWSWHITWNWWLKSWLGVPGEWFNGYRGNRLGFYSLINKSRFLKETGRFFTAIYSYDMFICSPRCSPTPSMRMVDAPATTWGWSHCASKLWRILVGWHCRLMRRTSMSGPDFFEQKTSNNSCPCWEKPQIYTPMDEIS